MNKTNLVIGLLISILLLFLGYLALVVYVLKFAYGYLNQIQEIVVVARSIPVYIDNIMETIDNVKVSINHFTIVLELIPDYLDKLDSSMNILNTVPYYFENLNNQSKSNLDIVLTSFNTLKDDLQTLQELKNGFDDISIELEQTGMISQMILEHSEHIDFVSGESLFLINTFPTYFTQINNSLNLLPEFIINSSRETVEKTLKGVEKLC